MSKIIYICHRKPGSYPSLKKDIETISLKLIPDNITPAPTKLVEQDGITYAVINPVSTIEELGTNVLLGKLFGAPNNWSIVGADYPDGTYALFRGGKDAVQVVSDASATRSIWYIKSDDLFIASTSQRAIISLTGKFSFNKKVLPWILSTGSPGPSMSWDTRINLLPPDSSVTLDRKSWSLSLDTRKITFSADEKTDAKHKACLEETLHDSFSSLNLDYSKWVLPLSGGYESRSILSFLNRTDPDSKKIRAITWGLNRSLLEKGNDAEVAVNVARHFGIDHKYYSTDQAEEPLELILDRFLVAGEGRVDHIGGYLDGFKLWKTLFEDGAEGIIRGDIGFSTTLPNSQFSIRKRLGIALCTDFPNLEGYESFGLEPQEFPHELEIQEGETLSGWRDRLYHSYRIPTVLAALTDLKVSFVEIVNPLLSRKMLYQIRRLPDHLRNDKKVFRQIADSINPAIPYASASATAKIKDVLTSVEMADLLRKELSSDDARNVFSNDFIAYVLPNIKVGSGVDNNKVSFKSLLRRYAPKWLKKKVINSTIKTGLSFNLIAFRMLIASRMFRMFNDDANHPRLSGSDAEPKEVFQ